MLSKNWTNSGFICFGIGKGQLIWKALFGNLKFFQKKEHANPFLLLLGKKPELICSFFGRIRGYQKCFGN